MTIAIVGAVGVELDHAVLRAIIRRKAPMLNLPIARLGLPIALQAMVLIVWGREPVTCPPLFSAGPVMILGVRAQKLAPTACMAFPRPVRWGSRSIPMRAASSGRPC